VTASSATDLKATVLSIALAGSGGLFAGAASIGVSIARNLVGYTGITDDTGLDNKVQAYIHSATVRAAQDVLVKATASDTISTDATASGVAIAIGLGAAAAGSGVEASSRIGTLVRAELTETAASAGHDLTVDARSSATITKSRAIGVAISTSLVSVAITASNVTNDIADDVRAWIASATGKTVGAYRDVSVLATVTNASISGVEATTAAVSVGLYAASGGGLGIANTIDNTVQAYIGGSDTAAATTRSSLNLTAGRNALVAATETASTQADANAVSVSVSIGGAIGVAVVKNKILSDIAAWALGTTVLAVDLTISAKSTATVPQSRAIAVSAGLVAGAGNTSQVELKTLVQAWAQRASLTATDALAIAATATNTGLSEAHGGVLGGLAVGGMEAKATLGRGTGVDEVTASILGDTEILAGSLSLSAASTDDIRSESTAAAAGVVAGGGAASYTTTDQSTLAKIADATTITVGALDVRSDHSQAVDSQGDAYSLALAAGSGASATNDIQTKANIDIGDTTVTAVVITLSAKNTLRKRYYSDNDESNLRSGSANGVALSILASNTYIGTSSNPFQAVITIGTGASLKADGTNRDPGYFSIEAVTDVSAIDKINVQGISLVGSVTVAVSQIQAYTKAAVVVTGATLQNTVGDLLIATSASSAVRPSTNVLAASQITGVVSGTAVGQTTNDQTITLTDTTIKAGNVKIYAGRSATTGSPNQLESSANVEITAASLYPNINIPVALADITERNTITLAGSTQVKSLGDVDLVANRGLGTKRAKTSGMTLSLSLIPYGFDAPDGASDSSTNTVTIGTTTSVEAGLNSSSIVLIRQMTSGITIGAPLTAADKLALRTASIDPVDIPDDVPYSYAALNLSSIKFAVALGDIVKVATGHTAGGTVGSYYQYIAQTSPLGGIALESENYASSSWRLLGTVAIAATTTPQMPFGPTVADIDAGKYDYYASDVTVDLKTALTGQFYVIKPDALDAPALSYQNVGSLLLQQRAEIVDWIASHATNLEAVARYQLQLEAIDDTLSDLGLSQVSVQVANGDVVTAPSNLNYRFVGGGRDLIVLATEDFLDTLRWSSTTDAQTTGLVKIQPELNRDLDGIFVDMPSIYAAPGSIFVQADSVGDLASKVGTVLNARGGSRVTVINRTPFGMKVGDVIIRDNKRVTVVDGEMKVLAPGNVYFNSGVLLPKTYAGAPEIKILQPAWTGDNEFTHGGKTAQIPPISADLYILGDVINENGALTINNQGGSISASGEMRAESVTILARNDFSLNNEGWFHTNKDPRQYLTDNPLSYDALRAHLFSTASPDYNTLCLNSAGNVLESSSLTSCGSATSNFAGLLAELVSERNEDNTKILAQGRITITARYLNIDGLIQSGVQTVTLNVAAGFAPSATTDLSDALGKPIAGIDFGTEGVPVIGHYDAARRTIVLADIVPKGGQISLAGQILSTGHGQLKVAYGYTGVAIDNESPFDLSLGRIDVTTNRVGKITIIDTARLQKTVYTMTANGVVTETFAGTANTQPPAGDTSGDAVVTGITYTLTTTNASSPTAVDANGAASLSYAPRAGLQYVWVEGQAKTSTTVTVYEQNSFNLFGDNDFADLLSKDDSYVSRDVFYSDAQPLLESETLTDCNSATSGCAPAYAAGVVYSLQYFVKADKTTKVVYGSTIIKVVGGANDGKRYRHVIVAGGPTDSRFLLPSTDFTTADWQEVTSGTSFDFLSTYENASTTVDRWTTGGGWLRKKTVHTKITEVVGLKDYYTHTLKADEAIAINFVRGSLTPQVNILSKGSILLRGNFDVPTVGSVVLHSTAGGITAQDDVALFGAPVDANAEAGDVRLTVQGTSVGDAKAAHKVLASGSIVLNAVASAASTNGSVRAQTARLFVDQVVAGSDVFLNAAGGIAGTGTSLVKGDLVELSATAGGVGVSGTPLRVDSNVAGHGGLAIRARDDIRVNEITGDMLLVLAEHWTPTASVLSTTGGAYLQTTNGFILDGVYDQLAPTTQQDATDHNDALNAAFGRIQSTTTIGAVKGADNTANHTFTLKLDGQPDASTNEVVYVDLVPSGGLTLASVDPRFAGNRVRFDSTNWNTPVTINYTGATSGLTFTLSAEKDRPAFDTSLVQFPLSVALIHYLYPQLAVPAGGSTATETPNVVAATISLTAGGSSSQIGRISGLEHLNLAGGLAGLSTDDQAYLAGATVSDIIGKSHPLYRFIGTPGTRDLTTEDFGSADWQQVNVTFVLGNTSPSVTLVAGRTVLVQRRGIYGLYEYKAGTGSFNLGTENFLNTQRWTRLTNADGLAVIGQLTNADTSAVLSAGSLVADTTTLSRLTLQLVDDVDISAGANATKVTLTATAGDGIAIQADGALEVASVTSTGTNGDTRLRAGGAITNATGATATITTGGNLVLDSGASIGSALTPLRTTIAANRALFASAAGTITLRQLGNALRAEDVFSGVDTTITVATGSLTVGQIVAGGLVTLTTTAGSILDGLQDTPSGDGNVIAANGVLTAGGASSTIGATGKPLDLTLTGTLTALAGSSIWLVNRGDLDAVSITSTNGNVTLDVIAHLAEAGDLDVGAITAAHDIFLTAAGGVFHLAGNGATDIAGERARINAVSGAGTASSALTAAIANLESAVTAGGLWLTNTGSLTIGGVSTQVGIDTVGAVDIVTTAALTVSEAITSGGGAVTLRAGTGMTFGSGGSVDTESGAPTVTLTAAAGGIGMDDGSFVNARGGLITLTATGQVRLSLLTTTTDVTVTSSGADIVDNAVESPADGLEISAANALLHAATGIGTTGNPLELAVGRLEADAGSGGLFADDVAGLIVGGITSAALPGAASTTGLRAGGTIRVTSTGFLRIVENVVSTGAAVTLQAIDSATTTAANVVVPDTFGEQVSTGAADGSDLDEDLTVIGATVTAATIATLLAGDDMLIDAAGAVAGGTQVVLRIDHGDADPATGARLDVLGALTAPEILATGAREADVFYLHPTLVAGHAVLKGDVDGLAGGDDLFILDRLPNVDTAHKYIGGIPAGPGSLVTGHELVPVRFTIDLDGRGGGDRYVVDVTGSTDYLVNISDSGAADDGADILTINGTQATANVFLLRAKFVARMQPTGLAATDLAAAYERINYDDTINALRVNGGGAGDRFYLDDNSAITTVDGAGGDDKFQVGQLFAYDRLSTTGPTPSWVTPAGTLPAQVAPGDEIATVETTRGFLSRGISFSTAIYGGENDDSFLVYGNQAVLKLYGENGDDEFVIRAFALAGSSETASEETDIAGGAGDDHIEYNVNAPVGIDGGGGSDTLVAVGTEFSDDFYISSSAIMGAGLNIVYAGVERVEVDGMEGNDHFYVQSTSANAVTVISGGEGSDTIDVGGDVTGRIVAVSAEGISGAINHAVSSTDPNYDGILAPGLSLNVAGTDPDAGTVVIAQVDGTRVYEGGAGDSYTIHLAGTTPAAGTIAYLTISVSQSPAALLAQHARTVEFSADNGTTWLSILVLRFEVGAGPATAWTRTQTIMVRAIDDGVAEGPQTTTISHSISSTDAHFDRLIVANVDTQVIDNDRADLIVIPSGSDTHVVEDTSTDTYTVALTRAPGVGETVTVTMIFDATQLALSQSSVDFTAANWDTPVTITVSGLHDIVAENTQMWTITHEVSSSQVGGLFAGITEDYELPVELDDDDAGGVTVTQTGGSTLVDATTPDDYFLALTKPPTAPVTITILTDGKTLASAFDPSDTRFTAATADHAATVTFGPGDWSLPFHVKLTLDTTFVPSNPTQPTQSFPVSPHTLARLFGPLVVEGGDIVPRPLQTGVRLPTETDLEELHDAIVHVDESLKTDTLNIYNDGTVSSGTPANIGSLHAISAGEWLALNEIYGGPSVTPEIGTFGHVSGLAMGAALVPGHFERGIAYHDIEIVDILLGQGRDSFDVSKTVAGSITVVQGGGGDDTLTVSAAAGSSTGGVGAPLILLGDTTQDGAFYNVTTPTLKALGKAARARMFSNPGNDFIDARLATGGVTIYGGAGNDLIYGSTFSDQLAGGSGHDEIQGDLGDDHIYGDDGFNLNLSRRLSLSVQPLLVVTDPSGSDYLSGDALVVGNDTLGGGGGNDVVIGDIGVIDQLAGTNRLIDAGNITQIASRRPSVGGNDSLSGGAGNDVLIGGRGNDTLNAGDGTDGTGANLLIGDNGFATFGPAGRLLTIATTDALYGGTDTLFGGGGNDILFAGTGADTINDAGGDNLVFGDNGSVTGGTGTGTFGDLVLALSGATASTTDSAYGGNDRITTFVGNDVVFGGLGNDTINAGAGRNVVFGDGGTVAYGAAGGIVGITGDETGGDDRVTTGAGDDLVLGGLGSDIVNAGDGRNVVIGDAGHVVLDDAGNLLRAETVVRTGGGGNDTLTGGSGADDFLGGAGNDTILTGEGANVALGDDGILLYSSGRAIDIASTDTGEGSEAVGGDDRLTGGTGADILVGGIGNDVIDALGGDDLLVGDSARVLRDAAGTLVSAALTAPAWGGDDELDAGDGNDAVIGGAGADLIYGGGGNDTLLGDEGALTDTAGRVTLATSTPAADASGGDDTIYGEEGDDIVLGGGGADTIDGGNGNDALVGDSGQAELGTDGSLVRLLTLAGGWGAADTLSGGEGDDALLGGAGGDAIDTGGGSNIAIGDGGEVTWASGRPVTAGSTDTGADGPASGAADTLTGGSGDDVLIGGVGGDTITGNGGNDAVTGDNGRATFSGGFLQRIETIAPGFGGNDRITGTGNLYALGGTGSDTIENSGLNAIILGDDGYVDWVIGSSGPMEIATIAPTDTLDGAGDTITVTGPGNSYIIGGAGGDKIFGGNGNELVFGDFGVISGHVPLSLTVPSLPVPFTYTSVFTHNTDLPSGADDSIWVTGGRNIVIGGQGSDTIVGGPGNEDLIGGHNVADGDNGFDTINGGGGDDAVEYGNGAIALTGSHQSSNQPSDILGASPQTGSGPSRNSTHFNGRKHKKPKKKPKKKPGKKPSKKPSKKPKPKKKPTKKKRSAH
jgi:Ca2+-binding RTX toxin-like protein